MGASHSASPRLRREVWPTLHRRVKLGAQAHATKISLELRRLRALCGARVFLCLWRRGPIDPSLAQQGISAAGELDRRSRGRSRLPSKRGAERAERTGKRATSSRGWPLYSWPRYSRRWGTHAARRWRTHRDSRIVCYWSVRHHALSSSLCRHLRFASTFVCFVLVVSVCVCV